MKTTIENLFEFDFDALSTFLKVMDGYIAGSSVIYDYMMTLESVSWQPNDMDIWIPLPELTTVNVEFEREFGSEMHIKGQFPNYMQSVGTRIQMTHDFLKHNGWKRIYNDSSYCHNYDVFKKLSSMIYRIYSYKSINSNQKIQVIFTTGCEPIEILNTFDISGCRMAWSPSMGYDLTPEYVIEDLKQKRMFVEDKYYTDRTEERVDKYKHRGFKIYREIL